MLYGADRHSMRPLEWDAERAAAMIATIAADTKPYTATRSDRSTTTPTAELPAYPLYYGACGVVGALSAGRRAARLTILLGVPGRTARAIVHGS
jgi:hypothetical protein